MIKDITLINSNQYALKFQFQNIGKPGTFLRALRLLWLGHFLSILRPLPSSSNALKSGLKGKIDPSRNFLLKESTRMASIESETKAVTLYKLKNGVMVIHEVFSNALIGEKLRKISLEEMKETFGSVT